MLKQVSAPPAASRQAPSRRPFWIALGCQCLIVLAVPAAQVRAYAVGTTVLLRTAPVDPVDLLRGRYIALGYEAASAARLDALPGWTPALTQDGAGAYITFAPAPGERAWQPKAISATYPTALGAGEVAIFGRMRGGSTNFGLGAYYVPDAAGDGIQQALRGSRAGGLAELRVDGAGTPVLTGLWIGDSRY